MASPPAIIIRSGRTLPRLLAIEDDVDDFNAYYHTSNDDISHINLTYFTNFVKASVGTPRTWHAP